MNFWSNDAFLQILSLVEEKNHLAVTNEEAKKELQTIILQLEGQLKDNKSQEDALKTEIDTLKAEIAEKFVPKDSLKKLEEQIAKAEARTKEEVIPNLIRVNSVYVIYLSSQLRMSSQCWLI